MTRRILDSVIRPIELPEEVASRTALLSGTEWLVTNGLGGYASTTVAGPNSRRYHGVLVAALPNPFGRTVVLNQLDDGAGEVVAFRLEAGLPVWECQAEGARVERRLLMPHAQNTILIRYRLLSGNAASLRFRPWVHFRGYEDSVTTADNSPMHGNYRAMETGDWLAIQAKTQLPALRVRIDREAQQFTCDEQLRQELAFPVDADRGFAEKGSLWSPGYFVAELAAGREVIFVASTETPDVAGALTATDAWECEMERRRKLIRSAGDVVTDVVSAELTLAADQFIITPKSRVKDATWAKATGGELRTVIAGYHWFTDWGRDTMISLEGLTLVTGRYREAEFILRTFAHYVRDGLIPNLFPDGSNEGLYHTADATLWFFHALERYRKTTKDDELILALLPVMQSIIAAHAKGTRFGIAMDGSDGLLRQGAEGYQLTWMDAKVDGWVVTPRRGKAVEINALWYNALCLTACWTEEVRGSAAGTPYREMAMRARQSFNERFWNEEKGYLFDVVDGPDGSSDRCRPNQLIAISLDNPVLDRERWPAVLDVVKERLVTPVGLRSLAPGEPDYKARYFGDLRARDAAYHQGTVWAWLIGPWIDAWLKVHPEDREGARHFLDGFVDHLGEFGIGSIAEIFDATEPYTPRGCIAQAWSVAEVLRCWAKTAG